MINWAQVGEDFRQKYEGCFCRYKSPISGTVEVFKIMAVEVHARKAPDLTLFNNRVGDLYLTYSTDVELDFTFPETGYFQGDRMALILSKRYERQWKKGIMETTVSVATPYDGIRHVSNPYTQEFLLNEDRIKQMFQRPFISLTKGIEKMVEGMVSVALTRHMSIGLGNEKGILWLWYDWEPVAEVKNKTITMKVPPFEQEVRDYIRTFGDFYAVI